MSPTLPQTWVEGEFEDLPATLPAISLVLVTRHGLPITLLRTYRRLRTDQLPWLNDPRIPVPSSPDYVVIERATSYPAGWGRSVPTASVSVVIPTMAAPGRLEALLQDLRRDLASLNEVLIVVNGVPLEPVVARVASLTTDPKVRLLVSPPGLSAARNAGLRQARGDHCVLLDDDVRLGAGWRQGIDRAIGAWPQAAMITGSVLSTPPATPAQFWFETVGGFRKGFDEVAVNGRDISSARALFLASKVGTGAVMVLRRLERGYPLFEEMLGAGTLGIGGEDLDAVFGALATGAVVVFRPDIVVRHPAPVDEHALGRQSFAYGRGFSAMVTHQMVTRRVRVGQVLGLVPVATRTVLGRSGYAQDAAETFPVKYRLREALGLSIGPLDYARSRRGHRRPH